MWWVLTPLCRMEVCKDVSELWFDALVVVSGSANVMVTDAIKAGQRNGVLKVADDTRAKLGIKPEVDLFAALSDYLSSRIGGLDIVWESKPAHDKEACRLAWTATPFPVLASQRQPASHVYMDIIPVSYTARQMLLSYTSTYHQ